MYSKDFWKGKNILFIGDSITYALDSAYPSKVAQILGANFSVHGKPGAQLKTMIDGDVGGNDPFYPPINPLTEQDVKDKHLIVLFGGFNNRWNNIGKPDDNYDINKDEPWTIYGFMQHAVDSIKQQLIKANNQNCPILIVTVYFCGKYSWNCYAGDVTPPKNGCSFKDMAKAQIDVAIKNGLYYCDLYNTSDISPKTWHIYSANPNPTLPQFTPYLLDKDGNKVNDEYLIYEHGKKYYQIRDGKVVLEEYIEYPPYPFNGDQLHLNKNGYEHIATIIANKILQIK
jgi:hypothetical protein